jgi:hypothetical protein
MSIGWRWEWHQRLETFHPSGVPQNSVTDHLTAPIADIVWYSVQDTCSGRACMHEMFWGEGHMTK